MPITTQTSESTRSQLDSPRVQTLKGLCQSALSQASSRDELLLALAEILTKTIRPDTVARVYATAQDVKIDGLLHPVDGLSTEFQNAFSKYGLLACKTGQTQQTRLGRPPSIFFVAVPINQVHGCFDSLSAIFTSPNTTSDVLTAVMELVASHISLWDARCALQKTEDLAESATAVLDLIGRLQAEPTLKRASQKLIDELRPYLDGPHLALTVTQDADSPACKCLATSIDESIQDPQLIEFIESAATEVLIRGTISIWPAINAADQHSLLTHKQLAHHTQSQRVVCVPLKHNAMTPFGVLVAWGEETLVTPPDALHFLQAIAEPLAQTLASVKRSEKPWLQRMAGKIEKSFTSSTGLLWWTIAAILAFVMCIPCTYWVECECEVQPVVRRYISAPFDAKLEQAFVEPGDVVTKDQLLATLDGREILWELAGVAAEIHRVRKERDGHIAQQKYGDAEISKFESERLDLKHEMLSYRTKRLEIRSPIQGIIIAGDLKKTEGAPLSVGQSLFEIAPLQEMTIEVRIPEEEIAYVTPQQLIKIRLDSFPGRTWEEVLEQIQPRAELIEDSNAFLSEVIVDNSQELLRPGMRGRAWIQAPSRPLAWNLFHKSWERLLIWLGL